MKIGCEQKRVRNVKFKSEQEITWNGNHKLFDFIIFF